MLHCLAYGNSDQASFRDKVIRETFQILTVPSTIASYYPDATAAFVLSSRLSYMIEPRTPLFQEDLAEPRASHYTLASLMGSAVCDRLGDEGAARFPATFYTPDVCAQVVSSMTEFQRDYGGRAGDIEVKLDRYRRLYEQATGSLHSRDASEERRPPEMLLCPYFSAQSMSDPWWEVMERIWTAATEIDAPGELSAVVAVGDVSELGNAIDRVPDVMSSRVFFWVPGFDERRVSSERLLALTKMVSSVASSRSIVNLYGGYFSILLGKLGLAGLNNGLGYSESREWPALDATGAAPPRYYVRRLHAFVPSATAAALIENDSNFGCDCVVCTESNNSPRELTYHGLKKHFALARAWELDQCDSLTMSELCSKMREDVVRVERVRNRLPVGLGIPWKHLGKWAAVLES